MRTYEYDIFISYSHHNKEWVRNTLLVELERRGFKVAIDFRDFRTGEFTIDAIERLVQTSKRVLAVFSPSYSESEWGSLENILARTLDPSQKNRKLIPILYKPTNLSLSLRAINYLDFTNPTLQSWDQLVQSLI